MQRDRETAYELFQRGSRMLADRHPGAAAVLLMTAHIGLPVSTTHTITSAIMGVGATKRLSAVRWGVTTKIVSAWIFTLPGAGLLAAGVYALMMVVR